MVEVTLQASSMSDVEMPLQTNPAKDTQGLWHRVTRILIAVGVTASAACVGVLVHRGQTNRSTIAVTNAQRDYSVASNANSRWAEQPIARVPGVNTAQLSVKMIGAEVDGNHVVGHLVKLANPLGHVSLALPPDGCGTRELTTVTASSHNPVCRIAINAGYFNVHTGACIGNVVSDGRIVQTVPLSQGNVNFGIKGGNFFIGYFTPEEIASFDHMVSGVVWLVRNGKNYVEQGWKEANITVQTSGDKYATNLASRTAVGFDAAGRLMVVQVDGSIAIGHNKRGMNMKQVADLLIQHGAVQAINLDGGGSSAMARNGVLINYPSDNQPPSCDSSGLYQCERPVSTVLCLHEGHKGSDMGSSSNTPVPSMVVGALLALLAGVAFAIFVVKRTPCPNDEVDFDKQVSVDSTRSARDVAKRKRSLST